MKDLRRILLVIWIIALFAYLGTCLGLSYKNGISPDQAADGAFRFLYMIVPVLSAFVTFWFVIPTEPSKRDPRVDGDRRFFAVTITVAGHVIVYLFLLFLVVFPAFDTDSASRPILEDRLNRCFQVLTLAMTLMIPIVEYTLRGHKVALPAAANDGGGS